MLYLPPPPLAITRGQRRPAVTPLSLLLRQSRQFPLIRIPGVQGTPAERDSSLHYRGEALTPSRRDKFRAPTLRGTVRRSFRTKFARPAKICDTARQSSDHPARRCTTSPRQQRPPSLPQHTRAALQSSHFSNQENAKATLSVLPQKTKATVATDGEAIWM